MGNEAVPLILKYGRKKNMKMEERKKRSLNKEKRNKHREFKQMLVVLLRAPALVGNTPYVNTMKKNRILVITISLSARFP
jgi:hypothetical protein